MLVINNLDANGVKRSVEMLAQAIAESQAIVIPGVFRGVMSLMVRENSLLHFSVILLSKNRLPSFLISVMV